MRLSLPKLMAAALATSWLLGSAPARAQVTSEPSAVIFPDPAKFARGFYTEGEVGAVTFFGPASNAVAPGFAVGARFGYDIFRFFALQLHALGSTHQTKGDTPFSGQLLQTYQGTVEGKLTIRFVQLSLFAEGGLGAARMSTNLLYALGLRPLPHRVHGRRRRRHRLPLAVAALLDRAARRLLRAVRRQQQPGPDHHRLPEVHVLMRGARVGRAAAAALAAAAVACETVDLGTPPADVNACRPSQAVLRRRDLAELPVEGLRRRALLRLHLPRRRVQQLAAPDRPAQPGGGASR